MHGTSVGILGAAGAVGSATAFALALDGVERLVLADVARPLLHAQRMDLEALAAVLPGLDVQVGDLDALAACDVVVACAGVPHRDGAPRAAFLAENAEVLTPLADAIVARGNAVAPLPLVLVSNPVDALATLLARRLGGRAHVVGHTLNDTLRLRVAIARAHGCAAVDVEAWSVGEHGPHAVPLLSRVHVCGQRIALSPLERARVLAEVDGWYGRWQRLGTGRTTQWSSGWGVAAIVRALLCGGARPWAVSTPLEGIWGIECDVCLSAPALLGPGRAPRVLAWRVDAAERAAIARAADAVAACCDAVAGSLVAADGGMR
ncbi:MAG: malate dehydrogenase [Conexibacter sp.]